MERINLTIPQNKQILLSPSRDKIKFILEKNKNIFNNYSFTILNQPFKAVRENNRKRVVQKALTFSKIFDNNIEKKIDPSYKYIIQTGHQPNFFHPGIWIKNIFLEEVIKSLSFDKSIGLNIILDNDFYQEPSFYLPVFYNSKDLRLEKLNFLPISPKLPFEECMLPSLELIKEFTEKIIIKLKPLKDINLLNNFINFSHCLERSFHFCSQRYKGGNLGEFLGMARRYSENELNPNYLELPFSKVCNSDGFLSFFLEIIQNIESFSRIYNNKLDEHRKLFKIRNKINPSANLQIKENFIETPFWIWKKGDNRKKLYILKEQEKIYLYNDLYGKLFFVEKNNPKTLSMLKNALKKKQIKIRPKALLLTLYNRLFVSDLFIHGLGGAKYDQVTDEIIKEYFKVEPPHFLVISTTLFLDLKSYYSPSETTISLLKKKLRDLDFNPERFFSNIDLPEKDRVQMKQVVKKKTELIKKIKDTLLLPDDKRKISEEIKYINNLIREKLIPLKLELKQKIREDEKKEKQFKICNFREFPFCFFSAKELRQLLNF